MVCMLDDGLSQPRPDGSGLDMSWVATELPTSWKSSCSRVRFVSEMSIFLPVKVVG